VPTKNITVKVNSLGGVTTSYFVSADQLPLVTLLPFLGPQEAQLKETIDRAYARNDGKSAATVSAAAVQAAGATESVPAPEIASGPSAPAETVAVQPVHVSEPVATPAAISEPAAARADVPTPPTAPSRTHRTPAAAAASDLPIAGPAATVTGSERSGASRRSSVGAVKAAASARGDKQPSSRAR